MRLRKIILDSSIFIAGVLFLSVFCGGTNVVKAAGIDTEYERMDLIQNGAVTIPERNYNFMESDETSMITYYSDEDNAESEAERIARLQIAAQEIRANNEETLAERKEACAKVLYEGMTDLSVKIDVSQFALSTDEFREVISDVVNSNPELFYIKNGYGRSAFALSEDDSTYIVEYCYGFYEYQDENYNPDTVKINEMKQQVESKKKQILSEVLVNGMSTAEKLLMIHDYICLHTMYDKAAAVKAEEAGETYSNKYYPDSDFDIYGALIKGKAVCQGYALTFKYLAEAAGISNVGFASNTTHIWNVVTFGGASYYIDCTYDDSGWDTLGSAKHTNFLKSEDAFHHTILEKDRECKATTYDNAFWNKVNSAFFYYRSYYYYMGNDGNIWRTKMRTTVDINEANDAMQLVYASQLGTKATKSWDCTNAAKIALVSSSIVYHDKENIYYYNLKSGEQGVVERPVLEENELIYGILYTEDGFYYATKKQRVVDGEVAYPDTEQTINKWKLPQKVFAIPVDSITLSGKNQLRLTMESGGYKGEKTVLSAKILPEDATDKRIGEWISSDPLVATVDINGTVKAIGPGMTVITAMSFDQQVTGKFTVKVVYDGAIEGADGKVSYYDEGKRLTNQFHKIDGKQCYLDKDGYKVTGWQTISKQKYYFDKNGVMLTGWQTIDGKRYLFTKSGVMQTGWQTLNGKKYYFNKDGVMLTSWQSINGKRYLFTKDGVMLTGWQTSGGARYYFDKNGVMLTGWHKLSGKKYYFASNGIMQTGWKTIKKKKYYFNSKGVMQTGWKTIKKKKYYFNGSGVMQTGWKTIKKKKYYFNSKGVMQTGWKTIKKKKYYFNSKGVMLTGKRTIKGISYYFAKDGHLVS